MANGPRKKVKHGATAKKKGFRKYVMATKHRARDVDQIQDDIKKGGVSFTFDEDLPGGGQFYCTESGRHFATQAALDDHKKSKIYKKRLRVLKEPQYTQEEADLGAGMRKEVLPPAHGPKPATAHNSSSSSSSAMALE